MVGAGGLKRVPTQFIRNFKIGIPSGSEQQTIADFLDFETARIDALIAEQQRLIELLEEKRRAVISHTVTKGLDSSVPLKDSGVEWLGEIPAHWQIAKLSRLTTKIGSGKTPRGGADSYVNEGVMFIRSQNVYNSGLHLNDVVYITEETDAEMKNSRVFPEDVLINITGASIGRSSIVPLDFPMANVNQHVSIVRLRQKQIHAKWVAAVLQSHYVETLVHNAMTGAARDGLTGEALGQFRIPIPPKNEREKILEHLHRSTAQLDSLIFASRRILKVARERRSAVISAAVTGKIDVRAWQPTPTMDREVVAEVVGDG